jgi:heptosyltransferase-1
MNKILLVKTSSLGDVVHQMPAITEVRRNYPAAKIAWVVEEDYAPLARLHPGVDAVHPVAARRWWRQPGLAAWRELRAFARALRAEQYDRIVDTQGLLRSAIIARMARGERHGYDRFSAREPWATPLYDRGHRVERGLHAIMRNRLLSGAALGYAPAGDPDYGLADARLAEPTPAPYAVLLHGSAGADKRWQQAHWIALGATLEARGLDLRVPWGSEGEREGSDGIARALTRASVPGRKPLDQVARLLAGARLVVGVDTGLVHLAAALGVPLVAIFIASDPGLTGPRGSGPIAIVGKNGEAPSVDDVRNAAIQILAASALTRASR